MHDAPAGVAAVLFDLDGTLVDSAHDLAATVNDMLHARDRVSVPYAQLRAHAGSGARGMLEVAFDIVPGQSGYAALRDEFHDLYAQRMLVSAKLFPGVAHMLDMLDAHHVCWGIVTNKALRFAEPMCTALRLLPRAQVLIGGDSTPHTKPHPAPLMEAARHLKVAAPACVYVGDDLRDMQAGRAAGMRTLAAAWGYLGPDACLTAWDADAVITEPRGLLIWLELA